MTTIEEAVKVFVEKVPYRRPVKYARAGNTWYLYTENMMNGGAHLDVIENNYYSVDSNKVLPVIPLDMPKVNWISVPYNLRTPNTPKP